jgi:hypothetical protein
MYYYRKELTYCSKFNANHALSHPEPNVPEICVLECLNSLAKLFYEMGELDMALQYYQARLVTAQKTLTKVTDQQYCGICHPKNTSRCSNERQGPCPHAVELQHQIQETKNCIGRIHFLSGNLDVALRYTSRSC